MSNELLLEHILERLTRLDEKIDEINEFRWRFLGVYSGVSAVVAIVTTITMQVIFK